MGQNMGAVSQDYRIIRIIFVLWHLLKEDVCIRNSKEEKNAWRLSSFPVKHAYFLQEK